jgi:hypothetical protein
VLLVIVLLNRQKNPYLRVASLVRGTKTVVGDGAKAAANRRQSDLNQRQTNNHHHDPGDQVLMCLP